MAIVTLTTDFGLSDTYIAQMKGVILGIAPSAVIVDVTHMIEPHDVLGAALALDAAADAFPPGAIHVAVVDPGVGSDRRALAIATDRERLVGPDNGIFTALLAHRTIVDAVAIADQAFLAHPTSHTFHGRDVFAPAAAHLACGAPLRQLGEPAGRLVELALPHARIDPDAIEAHIIHVDRFGNLVTDLRHDDLARWLGQTSDRSIRIEVGEETLAGLCKTYADAPTGAALAYVGSSGRLEIAVNTGDAARALSLGRGAAVRILRG